MTSIMDLPTELHEQIIDFALHPTHRTISDDVLNFALVSRVWTPRCRHYLALSLDESTVKFKKLWRFTDLCQHPACTLAFVGTLLVSNVGNTRLGSKQNPLDHTAVSALFSRQFMSKERKGERILECVFTHLKQLTIERVGWWAFKDAARNSLLGGFRSVTQLGLRNVSFNSLGDFYELICSFPMLESLTFSLLHSLPEFSEPVKKQGLQLPSNLYSIEVTTVDIASVKAISVLCPCPSLRQFSWRSHAFYRLEEVECRAVGELLASAGSSLVNLSLTFDVDSLSNDITIRKPTLNVAIRQFTHFHKFVDLTKNPFLQNLTLDIHPDHFLVLFLKHSLPHPNSSIPALNVRRLSIPSLEHVLFALKTRIMFGLPTDNFTHTDLDLGLQHPVLANVQELEFEERGLFPRGTAVNKMGEVLSGVLERGVSLVTSNSNTSWNRLDS
ncbi:hypothetical protein GYMLUDRAFT_834180 [Collybiopsis luxurians FD-317 M1]|uniref:F-box domain-containing protein n=1 Tax=Collybiopsis luxurians FD-317 M1 TaxID=944289 RepID=A0A0D0BLK4_9AGAR|nr:hypothetical protein GYMLUDRAFT_834180 [Collybiopsis luxurians FD-317 M1]